MLGNKQYVKESSVVLAAGASETVNDAAAFGIGVLSNKFKVLLESEKVKSKKIEATYAKLKDVKSSASANPWALYQHTQSEGDEAEECIKEWVSVYV